MPDVGKRWSWNIRSSFKTFAYNDVELKTVPEYDKLSVVSTGAALEPAADGRTAGRPQPAGARGGNTGGGGGGAGRTSITAKAGAAPRTSSGSMARQSHTRHAGSLDRPSMLHRLQRGSRQLIDMGRLRANWISKTLVERSAEHDYVNEEDQGVVALLARHVDVPTEAWARLTAQMGSGAVEGQFWQSGYATNHTDHNRTPRVESQAAGDAAEEGAGKGKPKPRRSLFGLPILPPYNLLAVLWTMTILVLDLTYTAFWVPINVAFCTPEYGKLSSGCTSSDLVGGALYAANMLLGFQIGLVARHGYRKRTVVDGKQVAWLYIWYGKFWLDLLASVPFLYLVVMLMGRFRLKRAWINSLSLLRLLRMIRLVSISKVVYMDSLSGRFRESRLGPFMSVSVIYSVFLAYQLAVAINLFACIMVLCAYFQGYKDSWMSAVTWMQVPEASPMYQWYCAVYWMIVTATTTGFGDFAPRSLSEQIVANVAMLGGMIMFGVLVASIGNALSRATSEAQQAYNTRRKIMHVIEWAQNRGLPPDIKKKVQKFYTEKYGGTEDDASIDGSVMSSLPSRLRAKVAKAMCVPLLSEVHILGELDPEVQALIAEIMRPIRLPAGEDLCQQGDVATCLWILDEGSIEAVRYKEGSHRIDATPANPCLVGESVLLGDVLEGCRVRSWTLRTLTTCHLWGATIGELYPLLRIYPVVGNMAAEYIKIKTVGQSCDGHWCELVELLNMQLRQRQRVGEGEGEDGDLANGAGGGAAGAEREQQQLDEILNELKEASLMGSNPVQPVLDRLLTFLDARRTIPTPGPASPPEPPGAIGMAPPASHAAASRSNGVGVSSPRVLAPQQQCGMGVVVTGADRANGAGVPYSLISGGAAGQAGEGLGGSGGGAAFQSSAAAVTAPQLSFNYSGADLTKSGTSGGGWAAGPVQCPGCQRCVCPSCGQGVDPTAPPPMGTLGGGDAVDTAGVTAPAQPPGGGAGGGRPMPGPAVRAWVNRVGTLRRVSIGSRQDQVWATERRSVDRRQLGTMSIMPFGE